MTPAPVLYPPGEEYPLLFLGGIPAQSVRVALPNGGLIDADGYPQPFVDIANASIVLNITKLVGLSNATFVYGTYGGSDKVYGSFTPPPPVGTLFVVEGQSLAFAVSREANCCSSEEELLTVQADLIGDFCKRAPDAKVCKGHNEKATAPPLWSISSNSSSSKESGGVLANQDGESITSTPPTSPPPSSSPKDASSEKSGDGSVSQESPNVPSVPPTPAATTKSTSARRLVLSAAVGCLAIAATVL